MILVIAFNSGWHPDEVTPEMSVEDDCLDAKYTEIWEDLRNVFEIEIYHEDQEECKTVQDIIDMVMRRIVIQIIADNYNDGKYADIIEPEMSLDEALMGANSSILVKNLIKIEILTSDFEECATVQDILDVVRGTSGTSGRI